VYCKRERERKDAEKAAEKDAKAAEKTQKAKPAAVDPQAAGKKRKASVAVPAEAEVAAPTAAAPLTAKAHAQRLRAVASW